MSVFGEIDPEEWEYVLVKRRSASRKRVQGFDSALAAATAAQAEMHRSTVWDDFRVYAVPGGDAEFL
jgi:hypothetical protein